MKRIYLVVGELEDTNVVDVYECAYLTMAEADARCYQLEAHPDNRHIWYWIETFLEEK